VFVDPFTETLPILCIDEPVEGSCPFSAIETSIVEAIPAGSVPDFLLDCAENGRSFYSVWMRDSPRLGGMETLNSVTTFD